MDIKDREKEKTELLTKVKSLVVELKIDIKYSSHYYIDTETGKEEMTPDKELCVSFIPRDPKKSFSVKTSSFFYDGSIDFHRALIKLLKEVIKYLEP